MTIAITVTLPCGREYAGNAQNCTEEMLSSVLNRLEGEMTYLRLHVGEDFVIFPEEVIKTAVTKVSVFRP